MKKPVVQEPEPVIVPVRSTVGMGTNFKDYINERRQPERQPVLEQVPIQTMTEPQQSIAVPLMEQSVSAQQTEEPLAPAGQSPPEDLADVDLDTLLGMMW